MATDRRQREIARTREDILEAAGRAFMAAGYEAATMQDIAREAGYTAASLYTYFRSKQEIVHALLETMTGEYMRVFDEPIPPGLSFRQKFELVLFKHLELIDKRRGLLLTFTSQPGPTCAESHHHVFHEEFNARVRRLIEWLTANATPADLGNHDPVLAAYVLFGIAFSLMHRWIESGAEGRLAERASLICEFFFSGVAGQSPISGANPS